MKKLPNGISNYEELVEQNYYYVDKTMYIEKLESLSDKRIMFLRPRKFGKTLFTSTLENYYDILKVNKFENLYGETYIGRNPTKLKNSYHILKFNFSGIDTATEESASNGFKKRVIANIGVFVEKYKLEFYINIEDEPENILDNLFKAFSIQKEQEKIYVIIDEYDHFANELLGFHTEKFKTLVSKNGKIRKWYEILKEGTETVVDRIFITGVAPITLDSLTSGFNISNDITSDPRFNNMIGFNKEELITLMKKLEIKEEEQKNILPILKENYDGYQFSTDAEERIYNTNMCLVFLNKYTTFNKIPRDLVDVNIASDYSKLGKMLDLCTNENKQEIIEKTLSKEGILTDITEKFNPEIGFGEREFASMLFYLGYLTIDGEEFGMPILQIPNKVMQDIYSNYFIDLVSIETDLRIDPSEYNQMTKEIALEGKIDKITEKLHLYLNNLSNRDFQRFDEKYVKLLFYAIAMNLKIFSVKSEMEVNRKYPDLLIIPRDYTKNYKSVMIEFKYLKKDESNKLQEKQEEARKQILEYSEYEEIKAIQNLNKYTVIAVNDRVYVEKI